jgi:DNA-binding transcriptional ArsR family regulator
MMMDAQQLDATLLALADPTRRAIVRRLALGDARVTEIAAPFSMSLNAVSKHIRVLERAGLVRRRVVGREHILSFEPAPLDDAAAWIAAQQATWHGRFDQLEALLAVEDALANEEAIRRSSAQPGSGPAPARQHKIQEEDSRDDAT